jgi:hypothetical protein
VTIRGTLLAIWLLFWLAAVGCWLRSRTTHDWRLPREAGLFLLLGVPFFIAGAYFTRSSYPGEPTITTPVPVVASTPVLVLLPPGTPPPERPANYAEAVNAAQREAVRRYPELGRAGTPFNSRFVAMHRQRRFEEPAFFLDPNWPVTLADEVARTMPSDR